jgi:hypothetical protein
MSIARKLIPTGEETFPFKFQITTTTANTVFTCPLADYGALTPNLNIDWGDGSSSGLITSSSSTSRIHTYVSAGTYTVSISGFMPGFTVNNSSAIRNLITAIIQWGAVGVRAINFYGCVNITSIPSSASLSAVGGYDGLNEMVSYASFMRGTRITSIPSDIFAYSPLATTFTDTFSSVTTISTVPSGLFDSNVAATTFASCFFGCSALTSVPSTLFDLNINVVNFSGTFRNCRSLTNVLQFTYNTNVTIFNNVYNMSSTANALTGNAPDLWNRTPTPSGTDAFNNCTGLSNYASIPLNWK